MEFRPDPKPPKKEKKKKQFIKNKRFNDRFDYPTTWGFLTEPVMNEYLWSIRDHISFLTGKRIRKPDAEVFAHVLPKALNRYPKYRLNPENLIFLTREEHYLLDHGNSDQRKKYQKKHNCSFDKINKLYERLKKEYNTTYSIR